MYRAIVLLLAAVVFLLQGPQAIAGKWDPQWKQVDEAVNKGLPKTAIERLDPIIEGAMQDKAYPEAIKAIGRRSPWRATSRATSRRRRSPAWRPRSPRRPRRCVPVMEAILADWYWHYFQQNRWRFMQRTATAAAAGQGFHHLGPAAAPRRDRPAVHQGPVGRRRS